MKQQIKSGRLRQVSSSVSTLIKNKIRKKIIITKRACFFLRTSCASSAFPVFPRLFEDDFRAVEGYGVFWVLVSAATT